MILTHIDLVNFRLHRNSNILFSDKLNYIVGGNGQGKTTVLEAIYYLCTTKSLNLSSDFEAVSFGENFFEINGDFTNKTNNRVRFHYQLDNNKKSITIDNKKIYKASSVIGKFPIVTLIQTDHNITLGPPAERRKFVDSVISQASSTYLRILIDYNKTLRQRSSLLFQIRENNNKRLYEQLYSWNETLIKLGTEIIKHRIEFIDQFKDYLSGAYNRIMEGKEKPTVIYEYLNGNTAAEIKNTFSEMLIGHRDDELRRGVNLVGPHRDDFKFYINDLELRKYGSQGQHKTFQIALRYGEFFYLKDKLGKIPIFIMDDVFGELDANRVKKISTHLMELGQVFITLTDHSNLEHIMKRDDDALIEIVNGKVINA